MRVTYHIEAHVICREVGVPNLKVQFDIYYC